MKFVVRLVAFCMFFGLTRDVIAQSPPLTDPMSLNCVNSGGEWRVSRPVLFGVHDRVVRYFCICPEGKVNALTLEDCPIDGRYDLCVFRSAPRPWNTRAKNSVDVTSPASPPPAPARAVAPARPRAAQPATVELAVLNEFDYGKHPPLPPPAPEPMPTLAPAPAALAPVVAPAPAPPSPTPAPPPLTPPTVPEPSPAARRSYECGECNRDVRLYLGLGVSGFNGPKLTIKLGPTVNAGLSFEPNDNLYVLLDGGVLYTGERRLGAEVGLMAQYYRWRYVGFGLGGRGQWDNIGTVENSERTLKAEILHMAVTAGVAFRDDHGAFRLYFGLLKGKSVFEDGTPGTLGGYGSVGVTF